MRIFSTIPSTIELLSSSSFDSNNSSSSSSSKDILFAKLNKTKESTAVTKLKSKNTDNQADAILTVQKKLNDDRLAEIQHIQKDEKDLKHKS
jgi:hypothetical protein